MNCLFISYGRKYANGENKFFSRKKAIDFLFPDLSLIGMVAGISIMIYLVIQFLFTGWFFQMLVNKGVVPNLKYKSRFSIFIFPICFFYAKDLHIVIDEGTQGDTLNFKTRTIFFFLNPFYLLLQKIRISNLLMEDFHIFFLNRIPSTKKIHLVPPREKVLISGKLKNGSFDLEDRSRFPVYRLSLREIFMKKFKLDPGFSIGLFFHARDGYCKIGSGSLHTNLLSDSHGILRISGVTIGEFINMEIIPLLKNNVELATEFHHIKTGMSFRGVIGQNFLPEEAQANPELPQKRKVGFKFQIGHEEYRLPLDLGIRLLLSQLAKGTNLGGVVSETFGVLKSFVGEMLKSTPPQSIVEPESGLDTSRDQ